MKKQRLIVLVVMMAFVLTIFNGCGKKENTSEDTNVAKVENSKEENKKEQKKDEEPKEAIVLRCGLMNPATHPLAQGMTEFASILEKKSNNRIKIEFYPGGQLGDKKTHIQSLQTGALDIFMTTPGMLVDYGVDMMKVLSLPYLFNDIEHARAVEDSDIGQQFLDSIQSAGTRLVGIGMYQESPRNFFFTDKEVTSIADLKGMKLRTQKGSMYVDLMEVFGASATPIAFSELYSALQTGVVDGAEQPYSGYYANKFYEISKYFLLDGHEMSPNLIIFSEMVWNTLSQEDQKMITEAFQESKDYFRTISAENDAKIIDMLKANEVKILEPDNPQEWRDAARELYTKYGEGFEDLIKEIQSYSY